MDRMALGVQTREKADKQLVKALRRRGALPGVVYGQGKPDMLLSLDAKELGRLLTSRGQGLVDLRIDGGEKRELVMIRDVQRHPIDRTLRHVDFQRVAMDQPVDIELPLVITGEAPGVKTGGVLQVALRTVGVSGLPQHLPAHIAVDVSGLEMHEKLTVGDLQLPEGVQLRDDQDKVILSIVAPRAVVETGEAASAAGATDAAEEAPKTEE
ncbi:50S ribosomal protein L25 [Heliophilum fasciatum]|uniref:Large ribosomal subunit protein bL25 n=1 Tax=Heliophilum fasciatum TaxID=35700 RepID=A0A4R2RVL2_9FIRM|nr:50S ribosomal protein L25 [Heliophilum fasciatum]MCW2277022.1 large subunit ribosomal protein L25 [Heliophilum fasciatum]TCP68452.1 LSU ribosomal protein L25P [Heliophilum fasciatum]